MSEVFIRCALLVGSLLALLPTGATELSDKIAATHKISGRDDWYGCERTVFDFEGYEAWVVEPKAGVKVAEGNPWTWTMQWATAFVPRTSVPRLVNECGWRHATIITFKDKMNRHGLEVSKRFQDYLVGTLGFNPKANLIGMSWGGFYSIRYAVTYPEAVNRIYLDCPLVCFNKNRKKYNYGPWEAERPADDDWTKHPGMPLNLTDRLAATRIPVLLLYGGHDMTLPPETQAEEFIRRFTAASGNLRYTKRPMYGHHPHGVEINENTIIDFFRGQTRANAFESAFERLAASVHGGERTATFMHRKGQDERSYLKGVGTCAVCEFTLRPTPASEIHAKLFLPPPEAWSGRFWGIGSTSLGTGSTHMPYILPRLNEGAAVCEADMGTATGLFGPEVIKDFGWRAAHLMTVEAKKLIADFYGRPAAKCYFYGVSSGGGQALHEATRFPEDYDGVVAYVPAHYRTWHARRGRQLKRGMKLPGDRRPFMHKVLYGPNSVDEYNMEDEDFEKFIAAIKADVDVPGEDLSAFAARGGKVLVVSGMKDTIVDPSTAERFARGVVEKAGGWVAAESVFRLYQLPGRGHTRAAGVGGVEDIPSTRAMERWVETGEAPGALTGTLKGGGEKPVEPWRPLAPTGAGRMTSDALRVGTYNIRNSRADRDTPNAWDARRADLVNLIMKLDLDVFGLQEVCPDQAAYIRANLPGYDFVGDHREADRKSGEASPVVYRKSRFEAMRQGTFWLSETPDVPGRKGWGAACPRVCSYLVLREKTSGRRFCFANTHTDHVSAEAREKGMLLVIERMKDFGAGSPIVFTGDHNCCEDEKPAQAVSKILTNAICLSETAPEGSWRTFDGWTWCEEEASAVEALRHSPEVRNARRGSPDEEKIDGCHPYERFGPRIDYIYVSPGVRVRDYRTVNAARPGTKLYPSDHFPVVATIELPSGS